MGADGGQRGEQDRVVERPAPDRREHGLAPVVAERGEDAVALAHAHARGDAGGRRRSAAQPVAELLDRAVTRRSGPSAASSSVADPGEDEEDGQADDRGLEQARG